MTHRDWHSFQEALAAYNAAQARHENALQRWSAAVSAFDRKKDKDGTDEYDTVEVLAGCAFFGAGWVAYSHGVLGTQWLWLFPFGLAITIHQSLDKRCRDYRKKRFLAANPPPEFTLEEPTFEPPEQSYAPPRNDPPPTPPTGKALTLDTALSILGLTRRSSLEELKRGYRERMREYHPDRVSHLGSELKELAERKAKEINAAYEYIQRSFQARSEP